MDRRLSGIQDSGSVDSPSSAVCDYLSDHALRQQQEGSLTSQKILEAELREPSLLSDLTGGKPIGVPLAGYRFPVLE